MPRRNYMLLFSLGPSSIFRVGNTFSAHVSPAADIQHLHCTFSCIIKRCYSLCALAYGRVYSQLPNLRGQAWASIGKSSSCMGHSADIVSLKAERKQLCEMRLLLSSSSSWSPIFQMNLSSYYKLFVSFRSQYAAEPREGPMMIPIEDE